MLPLQLFSLQHSGNPVPQLSADFSNAIKLSSAASGRLLNSHRILFFGAGPVRVASQLMSFLTLLGMTEDARRQIWLTLRYSRTVWPNTKII